MRKRFIVFFVLACAVMLASVGNAQNNGQAVFGIDSDLTAVSLQGGRVVRGVGASKDVGFAVYVKNVDAFFGYKIDITLNLSEQFNLCALPIVGSPSGPSGCSPALVENSDLSYLVYVASGGTLNLPDTTINFNVGGNITSTTIPTLKTQTINVVWQ